MSKPLRTNPAYAHLAYKKAILRRTIVFLRRTFVGDELTDPRETLVCEEVFPVDSNVPQEEIQHYIENLTDEEAEIQRQLSKFQLVAPIEGRHEQKSSKNSRQPHPKGGAGNGKGGRHH